MPTWLTLPAQLTTPLEAVNVLIACIGEAPVSSVDPPPTSDVSTALNVLNERDLALQSRGWHWNTEVEYPLTKNGSNEIVLPSQTLSVVPSASNTTTYDVADRGGKLYDRTNHTFVFPASIPAPKVDLIVRLSWDLLPQVARQVITLEAAQRFTAEMQEARVVLQVNARDVTQAWATLEQHEDRTTTGQNSVTNSPGVMSALYGHGSLRRNR